MEQQGADREQLRPVGCPNGHDNPKAQKFLGTCAAPLPGPLAGQGTEVVPAKRPLSRRPVLAVVSVAVAAIIPVVPFLLPPEETLSTRSTAHSRCRSWRQAYPRLLVSAWAEWVFRTTWRAWANSPFGPCPLPGSRRGSCWLISPIAERRIAEDTASRGGHNAAQREGKTRSPVAL